MRKNCINSLPRITRIRGVNSLRLGSEIGSPPEDLVLRMPLHLEIDLASLAVTLFVRRIVADDVSLIYVGKDPRVNLLCLRGGFQELRPTTSDDCNGHKRRLLFVLKLSPPPVVLFREILFVARYPFLHFSSPVRSHGFQDLGLCCLTIGPDFFRLLLDR